MMTVTVEQEKIIFIYDKKDGNWRTSAGFESSGNVYTLELEKKNDSNVWMVILWGGLWEMERAHGENETKALFNLIQNLANRDKEPRVDRQSIGYIYERIQIILDFIMPVLSEEFDTQLPEEFREKLQELQTATESLLNNLTTTFKALAEEHVPSSR